MSIALHLPALQVVIPLVSAPLAVLARRGGGAFVVTTAAAWLAFAVAIALWLRTGADPAPISYAMGSWVRVSAQFDGHLIRLVEGNLARKCRWHAAEGQQSGSCGKLDPRVNPEFVASKQTPGQQERG